MDCRLNMLFAAHDMTGKIATFISHFARETHRLEDYYFGDGEKFGDTNMIIRENVETHQWVLLSDYDERAMTAFTRRFGFLPIEELAAAHGLIFVEDELDDRVFLSPFQVALIMEKFHSKNLVNWKAIVSSY